MVNYYDIIAMWEFYVIIKSSGVKSLAKRSNQKLKVLYLLKILLENTDEENGMTVKDIIAELDRYGILPRENLYTVI